MSRYRSRPARTSFVVLAALAGLAALLAGACGGEARSSDLRVYLGYADSGYQPHQKPTAGRFPAPWQGDRNVNFVGQGPNFDAGAIRIENPGDRALKVDRVTVDLNEKKYDLWGSGLTVPAHGSLILTQTDQNQKAGPNGTPTIEPNFDTSEKTDAPGTTTPGRSVVHVTINGKVADVRDDKKALTTNGVDLGSAQGNPNESEPWALAGTVAYEDEPAGAPNPLGAAGLAAFLVALLGFLPALLGALLLLLVGWWLARWVVRLLAALLARTGLDVAAERMRLVPAAIHGPAHGDRLEADGRLHPHRGSLSWLLAVIVGAFIFLLFAIAAMDALHLAPVADLLNRVILWIPQLLVAVLVLAAALFLARLLGGSVGAAASSAGLPGGLISAAVRGLILLVGVTAAMEQVGIGGSLAQALFTALCIALALALGLAFGLGGESTARQIIDRWRGRRPELS